jgi:hypothetical protein
MKTLFRIVGYGFFVYLILGVLINLFKVASQPASSCREYSLRDKKTKDCSYFRNWELPQTKTEFCTNYRSQQSVSDQRELERNAIVENGIDYNNYWGSVYRHLVAQNKDYVRFVADSLRQISRNENFDPTQFAELIVSFVQDIPYSYVLGDECRSTKTGKHPCVGNVAFGILSPYEFIHSLYGDCDTRAVLLYALFEDLGFRPMIVVSNEYAHAMLALDIPSTGNFIMHNRDKFYFWETTATGWTAGMLPPDMNNINYWKIALVNEL